MIDFLKYKWFYFIISSLVITIGLFSIFTFGFKYSIDFSGGSVIEYQIKQGIKKDDIKKAFENKKIRVFSLQQTKDSYLLRTTVVDEKKEAAIRQELKSKNKIKQLTLLRFETVGSSLGKETVNKTIIASLLAVCGILLYMSFSFKKITYGLAAVIEIVHDLLVLVGLYSLLTHFFSAEVDTLFVTAILTTMSFSVHDTIVVFDKIRELKESSSDSLETITNQALTSTMVRSINNSLTIILMLIPLVFFSGESIKYFAAALLIGTITGTYSSPFVGTPLFVFFESKFNKKI